MAVASPPTGPEGKAPLTIAEVRERLAPFLAANPISTIGEIPAGDKRPIGIQKPWGDDSLAFLIPDDIQPFADALNQLYLPERFTAVWHRDTKDMEVIWTAFPLPDFAVELRQRSFSFRLGEVEYRCQFDRSSERLLTFAKESLPISVSNTAYRNMPSFATYAHRRAGARGRDEQETSVVGEPLSFWIRAIEWNEDAVLSLVNHLNFYLTYYDALSPAIQIHTPKVEADAAQPQTRYVIGHFPHSIVSQTLDDNLLQLWAARRIGDPQHRFMYCFRIIEYAGLLYLEDTTRTAVHQILFAPHALDNIRVTTENVLAALEKSTLDEYQRFDALMRATVSPQLLWREIELNRNAFITTPVFDGGFKLQRPIISDQDREANFLSQGVTNVARAFKEIRNALSHGKNHKTGGVITPTTRNGERLRPWVSLISVAAGQVMLYREAL